MQSASCQRDGEQTGQGLSSHLSERVAIANSTPLHQTHIKNHFSGPVSKLGIDQLYWVGSPLLHEVRSSPG